MSRANTVAKNTAFKMVFKVVTILSSFAIRTVFVYTLGDQYTGLSSLFKSILTILSFTELGIGTTITFALYKPIAHKDNHKIAQLMGLYRKAYAIIGGLILLLGLAVIPFLNRIVTDVPDIKENITYIYIWQLVNTAISYFYVYRVTLITASEKDHIISKIDSALYAVRAIAEICVLLITKSYWGYLFVTTVYTITRNVVMTLYSKKKFPLSKIEKGDRLTDNERKGIFQNVKAMAIFKVSDVVLEGTDSVIISAYIGTSTLGKYSNYYLLMTTVKYAIDQLFSAAVPTIGNLNELTNTSEVKKVFDRLTFLAFWLATFSTAAFLVLANPFIGDVWLGRNRLLPVEAVYAIYIEFYFCLMTRPSRTIRESCGLFVQGKTRPLIMAVMNIVISLFLAKRIGLIGVVIGTIASRVLTQFWYDPYVIYKYLFKERINTYVKEITLKLTISILAIAATIVISNTINIENIYVSFVIKAIIAVLIPNVVLILLCRKDSNYSWIISTVRRMIKPVIEKRKSI